MNLYDNLCGAGDLPPGGALLHLHHGAPPLRPGKQLTQLKQLTSRKQPNQLTAQKQQKQLTLQQLIQFTSHLLKQLTSQKQQTQLALQQLTQLTSHLLKQLTSQKQPNQLTSQKQQIQLTSHRLKQLTSQKAKSAHFANASYTANFSKTTLHSSLHKSS